ncbi:MAG TPA: ABC transporter permease [Acidimicrobiia bacterium]|nr:ABC transporter permease [Acidimicrobiia bacterium]
MKVWTIGLTGLKRLLRDRSNIFFVFILPLAIILLVGATFGTTGGGPPVVVSHGGDSMSTSIVERLESAEVTIEEVSDEEVVADRVERGAASAGIVIPPDLQANVTAGETAQIGFVSRPDSPPSLQPILAAAVSDVTADYRVARVVSEQSDLDFEQAVGVVEPISAPGVSVDTETVGESLFGANVGQFSVGAAQELVLFVFLTALTGSAALIQSRQLGVTSRMLSTPTTVGQVVVGEGTARFLVGIFQGLYIIVVTLLAFGVEWGSPLGWIPLLVGLAGTGAGAAMLIGSFFNNDQQAGGISVMAGIGLAALGGCMLPIELFSPTMNRIAHLTPHAWAIDGLGELVYRGGSLGDVVTEVAVLFAYAVVLLTLAGWRLRAKIAIG